MTILSSLRDEVLDCDRSGAACSHFYERWVALGKNPVSATALKNSEEIELSRHKIEIYISLQFEKRFVSLDWRFFVEVQECARRTV